MVCHSRAANWVLGLTEMQMNKIHDYGGVRDEQLRTLEHLGVFKVNWLDHVEDIKRRGGDWLGAGQSLTAMLGLHAVLPAPPDPLQPLEDALRKRPQYTTLLPKRPGEYRRLADLTDRTADLDLRAAPTCRPTAPSATSRRAAAIH